MSTINVQQEIQSLLKEGFLEKQSRFLKKWRNRWFVLTPNVLMTFKERKVYTSPTQVIFLKDISSVKSAEEELSKEFAFRIDTQECTFYVAAMSITEKEQWMGQIGKTMVKLITKDQQ